MNDWELTQEEQDKLPKEYLKKYKRALIYINMTHAMGPYGGWATGHDILKDLGWTEVKKTKGHRSWISLVKPEIKTILEQQNKELSNFVERFKVGDICISVTNKLGIKYKIIECFPNYCTVKTLDEDNFIYEKVPYNYLEKLNKQS